MKVWKLQIKEKGKEHILTPELWSDRDKDYVIEFYGLNEPNVEWYKISCEYIY